MTIQEAIQILEDKDCIYYRSPYHQRRDAEKLGIEALKFVEKYKRMIMQPAQTLLPGETDESNETP